MLNGSAHLTPLGIVAAAIEDEINTDCLPDMQLGDTIRIVLSAEEVQRILDAFEIENETSAFQSRTLAPARERLALQASEGVV